MKPVLVAYDFSPYSRRALRLALRGFPFRGDNVVEAIHAIDEQLYKNVLSKSHIPDEGDVVEYLKADIERVKTEFTAGIADMPELVIRVERGHPSSVLIESARKLGPAALLIGGQGHGGVKEFMVGRTAQRVIREVTCPVYIVKDPLEGRVPRRLLCAVDFSEPSRKALKAAAELAAQCKIPFSLIHINENPYIPYLQRVAVEIHDEAALKEMLDQGRAKLAAFEKEVLGSARADTHHVVFGKIPDTINSHAEILHAGCIVMGAHGHSPLGRAFIGSVTEALVQKSGTDLLVVR